MVVQSRPCARKSFELEIGEQSTKALEMAALVRRQDEDSVSALF